VEKVIAMLDTDPTPPTAAQTFLVPLEVAETYEERFVPALFADWAPAVADAADLAPGQHVLDVACGTGILARTVADRVGDRGSVTGVDVNPAMLTVAARVRPDLDWRRGDAQALPFDDESFDRVVCQMALMFFADRAAAVREMVRVVRPGGIVTVMTPAALDTQPAWGPFVRVAARHAGPEAVGLLSTYWAAGDLGALIGLLTDAGLEIVATLTREGTARFGSIDQMVATEVESTPLVDLLTPETYQHIRDDAREALHPFEQSDGQAALPLIGHIVSGHRTPATTTK